MGSRIPCICSTFMDSEGCQPENAISWKDSHVTCSPLGPLQQLIESCLLAAAAYLVSRCKSYRSRLGPATIVLNQLQW